MEFKSSHLLDVSVFAPVHEQVTPAQVTDYMAPTVSSEPVCAKSSELALDRIS